MSAPVDDERAGVTVLELATYRLGREARSGADFEEAGLPIMGGCASCGATIAAYNACPTRTGYLMCATECAHGFAYPAADIADRAIFGAAA